MIFIWIYITYKTITFPFQEVTWDRKIVKDGITTNVGIDPYSGYPLFESSTTMLANYDSIHSHLIDYLEMKGWFYRVIESQIIPNHDIKNGDIVYYLINFPWPFRDRDLVAKHTTTIQNGRIQVNVQAIESEYIFKENLDLVRISELSARWELIDLGDDKTKVVFRSTSNSEFLPNWLVKIFIRQIPEQTLTNLRKRVTR